MPRSSRRFLCISPSVVSSWRQFVLDLCHGNRTWFLIRPQNTHISFWDPSVSIIRHLNITMSCRTSQFQRYKSRLKVTSSNVQRHSCNRCGAKHGRPRWSHNVYVFQCDHLVYKKMKVWKNQSPSKDASHFCAAPYMFSRVIGSKRLWDAVHVNRSQHTFP